MASLAETLAAQPIQQVDVVGSIDQGLSTGMKLATMQDSIQASKMRLEAQKENLETIKYNKALSSLTLLARTNPTIAKKMVPRVQDNLMKSGIAVDPLILENMATDEEYKRRMMSASDLLSGAATSPEARASGLQALGDFGEFDKGIEALTAARREASQEKMLNMRLESREQVSAAKEENRRREPTVGEKEFDKLFARQASDYIAGGGAATALNQLEALNEVIANLEMGKGTGLQGIIPKYGRDVLPGLQEGAAMEDAVKKIAQNSMRTILGSQFTEKEGMMILDRSFNPRQSPKENARRVRALVKELQAAAALKSRMMDYYQKNRMSLAGYDGPMSITIDGEQALIPMPDSKETKASAPQQDPQVKKAELFKQKVKQAYPDKTDEEIDAIIAEKTGKKGGE